IPTRRPTISESARLVSSVIRAAAASVSFMTCGRGRGFGFAAGVGEAGVMLAMSSFPTANQCLSSSRKTVKSPHSPHIEDETRLVGHAVRRPGRVPYQIHVDDADAGNAGDR